MQLDGEPWEQPLPETSAANPVITVCFHSPSKGTTTFVFALRHAATGATCTCLACLRAASPTRPRAAQRSLSHIILEAPVSPL